VVAAQFTQNKYKTMICSICRVIKISAGNILPDIYHIQALKVKNEHIACRYFLLRQRRKHQDFSFYGRFYIAICQKQYNTGKAKNNSRLLCLNLVINQKSKNVFSPGKGITGVLQQTLQRRRKEIKKL